MTRALHEVDFAHPVQDGDRISVYPVFEALAPQKAQG
jgi:hypothetical protein